MIDGRLDRKTRAWIVAHRAAVFRAARRVLGHDEDALDVTQETLFKLVHHGAKLTDDTVRPWLIRVATNRSIDVLRRRDPIARDTASADAVEERPDVLIDRERRERVRRALTTLAPRQAEIVALRFFEDLSFADAARAMGITAGAAKVHFRRALDQLRDRLSVSASPEPPPIRRNSR